MPYPNEHAARLKPPGRYEKMARENDKFGSGIDVIWGTTSDGKTEVQAIRFDRKKFTVAEAKKWLKDHDYKVMLFEPASEDGEKRNMENGFESVVVNLQPVVKKRKLEGKQYLVVPMVMLTEGVHNGSRGPLYYPPEELQKFPAVWDHKPIVIYHPTMEGKPISGCLPEVLNTRKVGLILHSKFEKGKLKAEAWLDPERLAEVDERVLKDLNEGKVVEVSTGLFTEDEPQEGTWNGEAYRAIARNYRPDHLAILPDQKGACSVADGAGLLRNQGQGEEDEAMEVIRALAFNALGKSFQETTSQLQKLLPNAGEVNGSFVVDVYPTYFVYQQGEDLYWQDYEKGTEGVKLKGQPEKVERKIEYKPVRNSEEGKETQMQKEQKVQALIANTATQWEEKDKDTLMALSEDVLDKMTPKASEPEATTNADKKTASKSKKNADDEEEKKDEEAAADDEMDDEDEEEKANKTKAKQNAEKPQTVEQFIANAPEGMRDMLSSGLSAYKAQKDKVIGVITANKANRFSKEQLSTKSMDELTALAALAQSGMKKNADYSALADTPKANAEEEPLEAPVLNFAGTK